MIDTNFIKSFLLKALKRGMNHEGQILVERTETNKFGTTYTHHHWVNPDELRETDKVIAGFHNLPSNHSQQLHPQVINAKFSRDGITSFELTHKLGMGRVKGCINSKGQRYFRIGEKTYSRAQLSNMLKKLDKSHQTSNTQKNNGDNPIVEVMNTATDEQKRLYKTVGLCAGDGKAEGLIRRLKEAMDTVFYNIAKATPAFSQEKLDKVKENWLEDLTNSWNRAYLQEHVNKFNSPEQYYSFMKDLIIKTSIPDNFKKLNQDDYPFELGSVSSNFSQFGSGSERWLKDVKNGKVSESDVDTYFSYLRQSLVEGDTRTDWEYIRHETGLNLEPFVPKNSKGYSDDLKPIYQEIDVKAKLTHVSQEEYDKLFKMIVKDYKVGTFDDKTQVFTRNELRHRIKGIYKIEGLSMEKDYQKLVAKNAKYKDKDYGGKNGAEDYFYHGTAIERSQRILGESGGFKSGSIANGQIFGRGHYLAGASSKSMGYMQGNTANENGYRGCMFICQGTLGNCEFGEQVFDLSMEDLEHTYDSIGIPAGVWDHDEWKVNNDSAVIPRYFVEIETQYN